MPYSRLTEFIDRLDRAGDLYRIKQPVSADLEITEISDRIMKQPGGGKAILFENVIGSSMPVAINLFGSTKRMAWALGVDNLDDIAARITELVKLPGNMPRTLPDIIALAPKLLPLGNIGPKVVSSGPCQEVVKLGNDASLDELPILKCWPGDGGPFITLPMVFTKEANTGKRNVGMYRIMKYDSHTTGMHWQRHKVGSRHYAEYEALGRDIPVAIVLGGDPALTYAATAPLPDEIDELLFAGSFGKSRSSW
jgi:4-hydroxy-3-polyprenylbenzoate decarboxylase